MRSTTLVRSVGERHPTLTRALHWATAILILISVTAILFRETTEEKLVRRVLLELHRQLGLLVLVALAVRIGLRLGGAFASHTRDLGARLRLVATVAHWLMYGVLGAVTLLGWALSSAHGIHLAFLAVLPLPDVVAADSDLADTLSDYHVLAAWLLLALVALHVLAALWHHYFRRDGVLMAMLPGRRVAR